MFLIYYNDVYHLKSVALEKKYTKITKNHSKVLSVTRAAVT